MAETDHTNTKKEEINQGLEGVVVAETKICSVDGAKGKLVYSGYLLDQLIERGLNYEDIAFLLLQGHLPSEQESQEFSDKLKAKRQLSQKVRDFVDAIPTGLDYMEALRTAVSVLSVEMNTDYPATVDQAMDVIAKAPILLSRYYRRNTGQEILESDPTLSQAANYLYLLTGNDCHSEAGKAYARGLDTYFITAIEHGMNASTFTARVATSTESDLVSAIVAAISTLKGPLHGGAPSEVIHMLDEIGTKENAEPWMRKVLDAGGRLMGFGHRVYKSYDPRAKALQQAVAEMPSDNERLELSRHVEQTAIRLLAEYKPGRNLYPNVEFGAAAVLRSVGLPAELFPATFGIARTAGWSAHVIEQSQHNRLIRPSAKYTGKLP